MAQEGGTGISEKELTCAICTEILYQPLALLDCLHTFCGACLKEWFKWQATSASNSRRSTSPYTCPSCREAVRRTKADWRLNTLLEGFLKANPDKVKPEQEKDDLAKLYKPGEDVLPPISRREEDGDSDDERLLAEVRQLSMADVDPETRRRAERFARRRRHGQYTSEDLSRTQQTSRSAAQQAQLAQLTEARLHEHEVNQPQIEHQPSLRSLLSASDDPQDVQAEILRSIYADGLLDGVDVDNLTTEQEEELTERIAEAYRRRQRRRERDRSGNRERRSPNASTTAVGENQSSRQSPRNVTTGQSQEPRSRPPISRPHLFEPSAHNSPRTHRRSQSATSQHSDRSQRHSEGASPAARSATDLSEHPSTGQPHRERRSRLSNTGRSVTDPDTGAIHEQIQQYRASSTNTPNQSSMPRPSGSDNRVDEVSHRRTASTNLNSGSSPNAASLQQVETQRTVRPEISHSAFAPEAVVNGTSQASAPELRCDRCQRSPIQHELHYNCRWCHDGNYNLCLNCYRDGKGCDHWFGFGFRAFERWYRNAPPQNWPLTLDRPHILAARRFAKARDPDTAQENSTAHILCEGAFCESCLAFANDCYWYCNVCLEGAWGFCDRCVKQGRHCTHSLLVVAHINTIRGGHVDPTKLSFIGMPHLRQDSYVNLPVSTSCDICSQPVTPTTSRFHCYLCNNGDYDICKECYSTLVSQGKIDRNQGPLGWRRCLKGHRMALIDIQSTNEGGHVRKNIREPVGGGLVKENDIAFQRQPAVSEYHPTSRDTMSCLALYNYFPKEDVADELAFPKNAEIKEVIKENGDWYLGRYAGTVGLFPSNHVRIL